MKAFKPQVSLNTSEGTEKNMAFNKYAKVVSGMRELLKLSFNNEVHVIRSRRSNWGEWFEYWSIVDGKPKITKSGFY